MVDPVVGVEALDDVARKVAQDRDGGKAVGKLLGDGSEGLQHGLYVG